MLALRRSGALRRPFSIGRTHAQPPRPRVAVGSDPQARLMPRSSLMPPANIEQCLLNAAPLVRKFAPQIASAASEKPIVDVACGSGRNALVLATLGCRVICV